MPLLIVSLLCYILADVAGTYHEAPTLHDDYNRAGHVMLAAAALWIFIEFAATVAKVVIKWRR